MTLVISNTFALKLSFIVPGLKWWVWSCSLSVLWLWIRVNHFLRVLQFYISLTFSIKPVGCITFEMISFWVAVYAWESRSVTVPSLLYQLLLSHPACTTELIASSSVVRALGSSFLCPLCLPPIVHPAIHALCSWSSECCQKTQMTLEPNTMPLTLADPQPTSMFLTYLLRSLFNTPPKCLVHHKYVHITHWKVSLYHSSRVLEHSY